MRKLLDKLKDFKIYLVVNIEALQHTKLYNFMKKGVKKIKGKKIKPKTFIKIVRFIGVLGIVGILLLGGLILVYANDIPDPSKINSRFVIESTKIVDRDDTLLYEIHDEVKRTLIPFEEMPDNIKNATIAIEDKDFYTHKGVDFTGIMRAVYKNATGGTTQGGSSITQQLVKNALLSREKTITRKLKELILTIQIEKKLTKDEILELYLNEIPYGENAYGIQAAAQTYFGKDAKDLTLAESAYLAALPQRPSYLNPYGRHREDLEHRKNLVLSRMAELGFISNEQAEEGMAAAVEFRAARTNILAPHFSLYIKELLEDKYGTDDLKELGLKVTTTLDYDLQKMAEEAIASGKEKYTRYGASNASMVAIDPATGEVLALVGSADYFDDENQGQVNAAMRDLQPGSSFKPYAYITAFEEGYSPATMLMDVRTVFGDGYSPQNYDGSQRGPISMRQALAGSLNIPAVKALALVGVRDTIETAKRLGISSDLSERRCGLSLVLGGCEIKLIDHTAAYGVMANGGVRHETKFILKIEDKDGKVLFEQEDNRGKKVLDEEIAYQISHVLSDNAARSYVFGPNSSLQLGSRPVAAKTGTTQNWRDAWTMGYTPQLAVGVWVGNMDGTLMGRGADGSIVAAPIWNTFMKNAHANKPIVGFLRPSGIIEVEVDALSGLLPTNATVQTKTEIFSSSFNAPQKFDDVHKLVKINRENGKLATEDTPPELVVTKLFTVLRSQRPSDPSWEQPVQAWALANGYEYPPIEKDGDGKTLGGGTDDQTQITIFKPKQNQVFSREDTVSISISADEVLNKNDFKVFLRDKTGFTESISGNAEIISSNTEKQTIYNLSWKIPKDYPAGNYSIFASVLNSRSEVVDISIVEPPESKIIE